MFDFLKRYEKKTPALREDQKKIFLIVGIAACSILLAAGIAYLVYRLISRRAELELEEYEDDPEDDFFEDEES